jgi:transposase
MKSRAQSDIQALHRARERLVAERTALINHLRALLTFPRKSGHRVTRISPLLDRG